MPDRPRPATRRSERNAGLNELLSLKVRNARNDFVAARVANNGCGVHLHDTFTICLMREGTTRFTIRGTEHVADAGDMFVIHPYEVHCGGRHFAPIEYDVFYVSSLLMNDWTGHRAADGSFPQLPAPVIRQSDLTLPVFSAVDHEPALDHHGENALADSIAHLFGALSNGQRRTGVPEGDCRSIEQACTLLHERVAEEIDFADLARDVGLSRFHFTRLFGRVTGMPPATYLRQIRLSAAARMISDGRSLAAAAVEAGFADQAHLTRTFKETYGYTPGQFARQTKVLPH